jgi:hypothetical protein
VREPAFELLGVEATTYICKLPDGASLSPTAPAIRRTLALRRKRFLEGQRLEALAPHHFVMPIGAVDRVTKQRYQRDVREYRGDPGGHIGMSEVRRRRFPCDKVATTQAPREAASGRRKEGAIPVDTLREMEIEEMQLLRPTDGCVPCVGP